MKDYGNDGIDAYICHVMEEEPDIPIRYVLEHLSDLYDHVKKICDNETSYIADKFKSAGIEIEPEDLAMIHHDYDDDDEYSRVMYGSDILIELQTNNFVPWISKLDFDLLYQFGDKYGYEKFTKFIETVGPGFDFDLLSHTQTEHDASIANEHDLMKLMSYVFNGGHITVEPKMVDKFRTRISYSEDGDMYRQMFKIMEVKGMKMPKITYTDSETDDMLKTVFAPIFGRPVNQITLYYSVGDNLTESVTVDRPTSLNDTRPASRHYGPLKINGVRTPLKTDVFYKVLDGAIISEPQTYF